MIHLKIERRGGASVALRDRKIKLPEEEPEARQEKPKKQKKEKIKVKRQKSEGDLRPLGRIIYLLMTAKEKLCASGLVSKKLAGERALIKARSGGCEDGYADYALKLRLIRTLLCILLVAAILLGLIFSGGRLGIDDLYYMAMDIGHMNSYTESSSGILNYTQTQTNCDFALYKKGLAVAGNSEVKIFNSTGRVTLTSGDIFSNPVIVTSNKYVLVYDLGGNKFSVYNSFKRLHTFTFDGKISYASMCEDGGFAVAVSSQDYNSVVYMYDEDCNKIGTYSCNEYVISAQMSQNGKYTAVLATSAKNGKMTSKITVLKKNGKKIYSQFNTDDVTPYKCEILDNNRIAVFCSDRMVVYSLKGKMKQEYMYNDSRLSYISFGEDAISLLFEDDLINGQNTLVVLNKNGRCIYSGKIQGSFTDICMYKDCVFLLTNNGICKFNFRTKVTVFEEATDTFGKILVCDKNRVLLCTHSRGIYFNIE